jgi:hypothetical protein
VAKVFDTIEPAIERWVARQQMFFVGTAPLAADGQVHIAPKAPIGTLAILGPLEVAYLDLAGRGAETIAHLRENGRIVVMLCAFGGPPRIVRFHGRGEVVLPDDERFAELELRFAGTAEEAAHRAIVRIDVDRVSDSCGYGVPLMDDAGERERRPKRIPAEA